MDAPDRKLDSIAATKKSEAQNYDFELKKKKYFKGRYGTSSYALTTQVLNESKWTPETLEHRQEKLLSVLTENWELECDADVESASVENQTQNARMKNFRFSDYGIPVGAELTFFRKPTIKCTVADVNNKVRYNGAEYSLSALAKKLLSEHISEKSSGLRTLWYTIVMVVLYFISYAIQQRWVFASHKQKSDAR